MHPLAETLLNEPVIAAVKTDESLTAALASPCSTVFLLADESRVIDKGGVKGGFVNQNQDETG